MCPDSSTQLALRSFGADHFGTHASFLQTWGKSQTVAKCCLIMWYEGQSEALKKLTWKGDIYINIYIDITTTKPNRPNWPIWWKWGGLHFPLGAVEGGPIFLKRRKTEEDLKQKCICWCKQTYKQKDGLTDIATLRLNWPSESIHGKSPFWMEDGGIT